MGIQVEFKDGIQGEVPETVLDRLIEMNLIARFKRQSGWAELGRDPVRRRSPMISLPERRALAREWSGNEFTVSANE